MATEKTPALYMNKVSFDNEEEQTDKYCSRNTIFWIFAASLLVLFILSAQSLYQVIGHRSPTPSIEVKIIPYGTSDSSSLEDKEHTTMNPWDSEFLIDPSELCATQIPPNLYKYQQDPEVKLLMLVPSATNHFEQRRAIRNTWGSIAGKLLGPMRLGFVLGTTDNRTVDDLVQIESSKYKDIIQVDFVDSYYHLATKSVLMLKWVAKRCPHAQYFLKAHDDTFVNVGIIADILGTEPFVSEKKFIGGYVHTGAQPSRIPQEKYYISEEVYPYDEYPPYTSGSAYVMTGPTAIELFDASKKVEPFLQQEDVYLTGLCAQHIDAPRIHDPRFIYNDPPSPPSWSAYSSLATAHSVTPDAFEVVWNDMIKSTQSVLSHLSDQGFSINSTILLRKKRNP